MQIVALNDFKVLGKNLVTKSFEFTDTLNDIPGCF